MSDHSARQLKTHINERLSDPLLSLDQREKLHNQRPIDSNWKRFKEYFLKEVQTCQRIIYFDARVQPENNQTNLVKNTKYNMLTFVPLVLYNQFKFFFNLFFLVTALTQLVEVLKVGLFITFIGPLIMVLGLTMAKQAYDDYRTYLRDIEANSKVYDVIRSDRIDKIKSKDLKIGDIVKMEGGDRVPADVAVLYSQNQQGTLFIKTDQLDGETDWKLRKALKKTQAMIGNPDQYHDLVHQSMKCQVNPPEGEIYDFKGVFIQEEIRERLTLENTMWTSTVLTNGTVLGLVMYIGRQTRISLGSSSARSKFGILDMQINFLSKVLFLIMVLMTTGFLLLQGTEFDYIPIQFMRMLILLSSIIPISMRVNLDFAKLYYASGINKDANIQDAVARNSNIPEELGRVKYILSDKTGTLTQNQMIYKQISIGEELKLTSEQSHEIIDVIRDYDEVAVVGSKEKYIKEIITALALCHNVTPVYDEAKTRKDFQASSPDQITFVKMAEQFGISLEDRTQNNIRIKIPSGREINYEILHTFPFKSETKRMGIILKNKQTADITFYLKGADSVMRDFIPSKQKKGFIDQECRDLSMTGLRTLVLTKKVLRAEVYENWTRRYEDAYNNSKNEEAELILREIENGVEFLGITGIEDKLQNNLKQTIENLRAAEIKIWMITGDKIETAQCIGRSCGLQKTTQINFKIQDAVNAPLWDPKWVSLKENINKVLIIDGKTLTFVLENQQISEDFFKTAMKMPAVICCRCSPNQKKVLTEGVKKYKGAKESVLGIGDGGNDVGMIQAADVGVGIVGKEGKQAALAADFSIMQFGHLKNLLLWHGRLSYKRSALLASFIIHRGFIVSVIQMIFSCVFYYTSIPVFNSFLQLGYATIFTFWPVFSLILDEDVNLKIALRYPKLYYSLQSMNSLSLQNFLNWIGKAMFQGAVIMILTLVFFKEESYLKLQTIAFSILIITEYCLTLSEINRIHQYTLFCVVGSIVCYLLCVIFLNDYLHVTSLTVSNFLFICAITGISWGPLLIYKIIRKKFFPTDYEKVMKTTHRALIGTAPLFQQSRIHDTQRLSAIQ